METLKTVTASKLKRGDVVHRFPVYGNPQEIFDATQSRRIQAYEIVSINTAADVIGLVMAAETVPVYELPGRIGRLFIRRLDLVNEETWWI